MRMKSAGPVRDAKASRCGKRGKTDSGVSSEVSVLTPFLSNDGMRNPLRRCFGNPGGRAGDVENRADIISPAEQVEKFVLPGKQVASCVAETLNHAFQILL